MDKQVINGVISMINSFDCLHMRQTFLNLQEDENSTNAQLVQDAQNWNAYLDTYCAIYTHLNGNTPVL